MKKQDPVLGYGGFLKESTNRALESTKDRIANTIISIKSLNDRIEHIKSKPSKIFLNAIASDLQALVKRSKEIITASKNTMSSGLSEEEKVELKNSLSELQTKIGDVQTKTTEVISNAEKLCDPNMSNMRLVNFKDLDTWSTLSPEKNIGYKASSKETPLYNILSENGYGVFADIYRSERFGKNAKEINVNTDTSNVYTITIFKFWTEEMLEDEFDENWREEPDAVALLGKPIDDEEFYFNFFTNYNNFKEKAFIEKSLEYAKENYLVYKKLGIDVGGYTDLIRESDEALISYAESMGLTLDSLKDLPKVSILCYRAYHDSKAMHIAVDFFERKLLEKLTGYTV